jgi:dihydrofolate reductase
VPLEFHAIVAVDKNNAIGKNGMLPWHLKSELKHFKETTMGHPMILGRTTFDGFSKPLPGRDHLVLTTKSIQPMERVFAFPEKTKLLDFCHNKNFNKVFICGGSSIYQLFSKEINFWHISQIDIEIDGADAYLKAFDSHSFKLLSSQNFLDEFEKVSWVYKTYQRCR